MPFQPWGSRVQPDGENPTANYQRPPAKALQAIPGGCGGRSRRGCYRPLPQHRITDWLLARKCALHPRDSQDPKRKLRYTLQTIQVDGTWVNVDTGLPNKLVPEAIRAGLIPALRGYPTVSTEVKYGTSSRIDVLLEKDDGSKCYVEVKNTTLMRGKRALFPDAITSRGRKHLFELIDMVHEGHRAMMFYCISRADATSFGPATEVDPAYCETLLEAVKAGVELQAWSTLVQPKSFELGKRLRIHLPS